LAFGERNYLGKHRLELDKLVEISDDRPFARGLMLASHLGDRGVATKPTVPNVQPLKDSNFVIPGDPVDRLRNTRVDSDKKIGDAGFPIMAQEMRQQSCIIVDSYKKLH